jgi:hypothetical protein
MGKVTHKRHMPELHAAITGRVGGFSISAPTCTAA